MKKKRPPPRFRPLPFKDCIEDGEEFFDALDPDELEKIFNDFFLEIEEAMKEDEDENDFSVLQEFMWKPEMRGGGEEDEEEAKEADEQKPKRRRQMSLGKMFGTKRRTYGGEALGTEGR